MHSALCTTIQLASTLITSMFVCSAFAADFSHLLQQTALAQGAENRFVYPEFQKINKLTDYHFRMLTSGDLAFYCDGQGAGASLIAKGNLIALDAHAFLNYDASGEKCVGTKSDAVLKTCQARTIDKSGNRGTHEYRINPRSLQMGDQCAKPSLIANDWAVVELTEYVEGATPYQVFDLEKMGIKKTGYWTVQNLDTVTTSPLNSNFRVNGELKNVPTLCRMPMGHVEIELDSDLQPQKLWTNGCSSGLGNSGGGIKLPMGDSPAALVGIASWTQASTYDYKPYGLDNYTAGPLISGKFLAAINSCLQKCPPRQ